MHLLYRILRDEPADGAEGGGGGAAVADLDMTVESDYLSGAQDAITKDRGNKGAQGDAGGDNGKGGEGAPPPAAGSEAGDGKKDGAKGTEAGDGVSSIIDQALGKQQPEAGKADEKKDGQQAPPAENPEDKLTLSDRAAPETKRQFGELKTIAGTLRKDIAARDQKIKDLEARASSSSAPSPEHDQLKQDHQKLLDRLAVVDVRSHPQFVKDFTAPKARVTEALNGILTDHNIKGVDVQALASKPRAELGKAVAEATKDLPEFDKAEFIQGVRQLRGLSEAETAALSNAGEAAKNFATQRQTVQRQAFDGAWKGLEGKTGFQALTAGENATDDDKKAIDAYNAGIGQIKTTAERLAFQPTGEQEIASTATKAATYDFLVTHGLPRVQAEFSRAVKVIQAQNAEIAKLRGAKAEKGAAGGSGGSGGSSAGKDEDMDYLSEAKRFLPR